MKPILTLFGVLLLLVIELRTFAQNDRILVYFKTGVQRNPQPNQNTVTISSPSVARLFNRFGLNSNNISQSFPNFKEADTVNVEIGESSRRMNYAKVFSITLSDTIYKKALITALNNLPEVLYAESDGETSTNLIPNDIRFAQQWNMRNTIVPGADIHAENAWDIFTGNPNSIIAIIDAGVDVNHNDLNTKVAGGDVTFSTDFDILGRQLSHGTHVAGIAAATSNNNNGVTGVDWQARIFPRNVIGNGTSDAGISQAIIDAVDFNSNVWTLNHSWGTRPIGRGSTTIRSAFAYAYKNNRVSCVAMGNHHAGAPEDDDVVSFPAGFNSGLIAVGATDINDGPTGFSARGEHLDVSAPGDWVWSTNFSNDYIDESGTSMATPHVSGLASLLKGYNTNLANDDIEQIIRLTADDANALTNPGFDNQMGAGRINAERALTTLRDNILYQWSTTGSTVFASSNQETRNFLGVPGFTDGTYIVVRREIRTNVTFPTAMCTMVGAWGRGVGTTGYREDGNMCFGEGICEVVPGTLTNTGATLRTWIYDVWNYPLGQYLGTFPASANNAVFQYTVLGVPIPTTINGDNSVCTTTSNNYYIPDLPAGASVHWDVTPQGIITINSPDAPQTTLTKNSTGVITLIATISNACGGGPITVTKQNIAVGTPPQPGSIGVLLVDYFIGRIQVEITPVPGATSYNWYKDGVLQTIYHSTFADIPITRRKCDVGYGITVEAVNSCGASPQRYQSVFVPCNGYYVVSPNPASSTVTISVDEGITMQSTQNSSSIIKEIRIYDAQGNLKMYQRFNKVKTATFNISGLNNGTYFVEISNGTFKERCQLFIQK